MPRSRYAEYLNRGHPIQRNYLEVCFPHMEYAYRYMRYMSIIHTAVAMYFRHYIGDLYMVMYIVLLYAIRVLRFVWYALHK